MHRTLALVGVIGCLLASSAVAQTRPSLVPSRQSKPSQPPKTTVEFELVVRGSLGAGTRSRDWGRILQKQGATVRIRQPQFDDEPGVSETVRGTLRWVKVIGTLDSMGRIVLPDQTFRMSDTVKLKEWIDDLKLYGAQGSPEGKPLWGLSDEQFNILFAACSEPVPENSHGETLDVALQQMQLPEQFPIRYHSTAIAHLASLKKVAPVRQKLAGMSKGTGLAAVLAEYGLGYRPLRTPSNEIELVIQPLADLSDPWPVGWELEQEMRRGELAPSLFKMVPVNFQDVPLQDVLNAISEVAAIPIVIDHYAVEQQGIDLTGTTLSYPQKKVAWISVINSVAARNRMSQRLRIDERGQPFVHISPVVPRRRLDGP